MDVGNRPAEFFMSKIRSARTTFDEAGKHGLQDMIHLALHYRFSRFGTWMGYNPKKGVLLGILLLCAATQRTVSALAFPSHAASSDDFELWCERECV